MKKKANVSRLELLISIRQYTWGWKGEADQGIQASLDEIIHEWGHKDANEQVQVSWGVAQVNRIFDDVHAALPAWHDALTRFAAEVKAPEPPSSRSFHEGRMWQVADLAALESFFDGYAPERDTGSGDADRAIGWALMVHLRHEARMCIDFEIGIRSMKRCLNAFPTAIRHYRLGLAKLALDASVASQPASAVASQRLFLRTVSEIFEQPGLADVWEDAAYRIRAAP